MRPQSGVAFARIGLLGNPSDGYGGAAVALALPCFSASVTLTSAERFSIAAPDDGFASDSLASFADALERRGCDDAVRLLRAAIHRFVAHARGLDGVAADDPRLRFRVAYRTDIPRQVGLSGSSAIVIAALRALAAWFGVEIAPHALAELALAAEVEDLRIAAGPMDRIVQSYGGLLYMDLSGPRGPHAYRRLDPGLLPPLCVAWDPERGASSGVAHGDLRARFERGDRDVLDAVAALRGCAADGLDALERRDVRAFQRVVDRNFDLRASICEIAERDRRMIELARGRGAAAKFCGSGGSVVAVAREPAEIAPLVDAFGSAGFGARAVDAQDRDAR